MSFRVRIILIGAVVGAVLGATGAWAYGQAQESKRQPGSKPHALSSHNLQLAAGPADYVKVAVSLVSLVRQVVELFRPAEFQD